MSRRIDVKMVTGWLMVQALEAASMLRMDQKLCMKALINVTNIMALLPELREPGSFYV